MTPERLAEIEQLAWHSLLRETPREELRATVMELADEVRRLQSVVDSGNKAFLSVRATWKRNTDHRDARIGALESGLREACNWIADRTDNGADIVDRLLPLVDTTKETA